MVLPIQRDRPALEAPGYSVIRRATRRLRARFASRAQTRSHYAIRLSDAATHFESSIGDIAYCSGSGARTARLEPGECDGRRCEAGGRAVHVRAPGRLLRTQRMYSQFL